MKHRWQVQGFNLINDPGFGYEPARFRWRWQAERFSRRLLRDNHYPFRVAITDLRYS